MKANRKAKWFVGGASVLLFLVLAMTLVAAWVSRRPVDVGLVEDCLRPCPDSPNCVCSEYEGDGAIPPLAFEGDAELAWMSLLQFLEEEHVESLSIESDYVHAVYLTPILGFADDVEFRLDRDAQEIHVRSASRIGHSDMGTNRARIEDLRTRWSPGS